MDKLFYIAIVVSINLIFPAIVSAVGLPDGWEKGVYLIQRQREKGKSCDDKRVSPMEEALLPQYCSGEGTGFLMNFCGKTLLVSNRHVFLSNFPEPLYIRVRRKTGVEEFFRIGREWRGHPDPLVDIAVATIELPLGMSNDEYMAIYDTTAYGEDTDRRAEKPSSVFMSFKDIRVGDDVLILGFPVSIPSIAEILKTRAIPLLRSGIVSMKLPDETKVSPSTTLKNVVLVDSWIYHGNSGSPVFVPPTAVMYKNDRPHLQRNRPYIIGIVSSFLGWPDRPGGVNSGLAVVESADGIEKAAAQLPGAKCPAPPP
jgi:hypothetical protein